MPEVVLKRHAIERFNERVRPALTFKAAKRELERLLEFAEPASKCPWTDAMHADGYLLLSDGVALVVRQARNGLVVAETCITAGGSSEEIRERRNKRKADKRAAKRARNRHVHRRDHRPASEWNGEW